MASIKYWIEHPASFLQGLSVNGKLRWLPDKTYLKIMFRLRMGKKLNLDAPETFSEKLQWLKLYNHRPEYTTYADKYAVRAFIKERIGEDHLIPLLGVYDSWDQIDFERLPYRFVIKCNHDSGGIYIVKNKTKLDINAARQFIEKRLKKNFYWAGREWQYKDIPRKIIIEKFMEDETGELRDYKFMTFNGRVEWCFVCTDRFAGSRDENMHITHFDRNWNRLPFQRGYPVDSKPIEPPVHLDEMIKYAELLGAGIPLVRVDFYEISGKVYFGEMTFFSGGGMEPFNPEEWDRIMGDKIVLPEKRV